MSSLSGHARITRAAVAMLAEGGQGANGALDPARVAVRVVSRDVHDLLTLGHWRNAAQCRHFMRRFDGQSGREAYDEAVAWIRASAAEAAHALARGAAPSQALGDALHAVQDSFAPGHAEREAASGPLPGAIRRIRRYAGADKAGHAAGDEAWRGDGADGFSDAGRHAVQASCDLLRLIVDAGAVGGEPALGGFESYRRKWLAASPALSGERDGRIPFLRRF